MKIFKIYIILNDNIEYEDMIKSKIILDSKMVYKIIITPDGNCFFRSLSEFLYNTEEKYNIIRMVIYMYAKC